MTTFIPIERLTSGVCIHRVGGDFGPFGNAAEVVSCEFDPDGFYTVRAYLMETDGATEWVGQDWIVFHVDAGEKIEFAGQGIPPFMRPEGDVTIEEWAAKAEAHEMAADRAIVEADRVRGYVGREIDESLLVNTVAAAIGVSTDDRRGEFFGACDRASTLPDHGRLFPRHSVQSTSSSLMAGTSSRSMAAALGTRKPTRA
jgi:hypothetical protein